MDDDCGLKEEVYEMAGDIDEIWHELDSLKNNLIAVQKALDLMSKAVVLVREEVSPKEKE